MDSKRFNLAHEQIKTISWQTGYYVGAVIAFVSLTFGIVALSPYWWLIPFSIGFVIAYAVALFLYCVNIWQLVSDFPHVELRNIEALQTDRQTAEDDPQDEIEEAEDDTPQIAQRPIQPPVRERQAEFATVAEPMVAAVNYPQWIDSFDLPPHIKRQWVAEIWQARDKGQLRKVSANKLHGVTSADRTKHIDGKGEAAHLMDWLIDNRFVYEESIGNNQHEWSGVGRAYFPSPTQEGAH